MVTNRHHQAALGKTLPFSLLTAVAVVWCFERWDKFRVLTVSVAGIYVMFLLAITIPQVSVWNNPVSLWSRVVALHPDDPYGHRNLASGFVQIGQFQAALHHAEMSLALGSPDKDYVVRLRQYVSELNKAN